MASTSEKTFGSRLTNAQKLATHLATFTDYVPAIPECSLAAYNTLITDITTTNTTLATALANFATSAEARQQLFSKSPDSMIKCLSPISAYVIALYGKTSKEAELVVALVNKLRGEKTDKFKKDETGEWVSQPQRSYGSMTQNFSTLIDTLTSFGATYAPSTDNIKIVKLKALLTQLNNNNEAVTQTYGILKTQQDNRTNQYDTLTSHSSRIKETVKSIYGTTSTEYKLIKGLKI